MTAMKDDFYHGGLTDDEVRKNREKYRKRHMKNP